MAKRIDSNGVEWTVLKADALEKPVGTDELKTITDGTDATRSGLWEMLPGRQMTREELEVEMEEFYSPTKGAKSQYKSRVEELPER